MSVKAISSRDNAQYKALKQLASSAQARRKLGQTLLDGVHLCEAWLDHRGTPTLCVISEAMRGHPEVTSIVTRCVSLGTSCLALPDAMFASLSQVEHGPALLFVVEVPQSQRPPVINGLAVLLDGVQDPGNLGSILRSAAAAGVGQVICGRGTAAAWSPKVLRAAMGAHFVLDIVEHADLRTVIAGAHLPVYATSSHASTSIYATDLAGPCAWLFGHEGAGVSAELAPLVSRELTIPQQAGIESMNVAAAAAVCLFEQRRQRLASSRAV